MVVGIDMGMGFVVVFGVVRDVSLDVWGWEEVDVMDSLCLSRCWEGGQSALS
jgi:hypothetical protein